MSDRSNIGWTEASWNPLRGCTEISPGCAHCYAAALAARFSGPGQPYEGLAYTDAAGKPHWTGELRFVAHKLEEPLRWKQPRMIFVNSMSDLFHESVQDRWLDQIFGVMAACPRHVFQLLTKRADRMRDYLEGRPVLPNVWCGVSAEDQRRADERIPLLLETPAAVRWISYEPALGPVNFLGHLFDGQIAVISDQPGKRPNRLKWIVAGGESGPHHRRCDPAWIESVADQCIKAGVPLFVKQDSGPKPGRQGRLSDAAWSRKEYPA